MNDLKKMLGLLNGEIKLTTKLTNIPELDGKTIPETVDIMYIAFKSDKAMRKDNPKMWNGIKYYKKNKEMINMLYNLFDY